MEPSKSSLRKTFHAAFVALMFVLVALGGLAAGLRSWLPPLASEHGAGIDRMVNFLLVTVGAMFLAGHIVLAWFIWRASRREQVSFRLPSKRAERIWLAVPIILMSFVAEGDDVPWGAGVLAGGEAARARLQPRHSLVDERPVCSGGDVWIPDLQDTEPKGRVEARVDHVATRDEM